MVRSLLLLPLILLAAALAGAAPAEAQASGPTARDYSKLVGNGRYIFVMLATDDRAGSGVITDTYLRQRYRQSGLYHNDQSDRPLWTVFWYAPDVVISPDGRYLARFGPWPNTWDTYAVALTFYDWGQELRRYTIRDLVRDPWSLPNSNNTIDWLAYANYRESDDQLLVRTHAGDEYHFDARSGRILSRTFGPTPTPARYATHTPTTRPATLTPTSTRSTPPTGSIQADQDATLGILVLCATVLVLGGLGWTALRR